MFAPSRWCVHLRSLTHSLSTKTGSEGIGEDWLLGQTAELVSEISVWEEKAENLTVVANEAYERLKGSSSVAVNSVMQEITDRLDSDAEANYQISKSRDAKVTGSDDESADSIVGEVISSRDAYEAVVSLPLKRYILQGDRRPYNRESEKSNERATRHHVGVIHNDVDNVSSTDPSSIFALNVGAIAQVSDNFLRQASKINASSYYIDEQMTGELSDLKARIERNGFKSPKQVAFDHAALEAEAALTRVNLLFQRARYSVGLELLHMRSANLVKSAYRKSWADERLDYYQNAALLGRDRGAQYVEALVDSVSVNLDAIEQMEGIWNSTTRYARMECSTGPRRRITALPAFVGLSRDLKEMIDAGEVESRVEAEAIHAEASVERENEAFALKQIDTSGKFRLDEIVSSIEAVFRHTADCFGHILTEDGRRQFFFYCLVVAVVVLSTLTTREIVSVGSAIVLRFFTTPRLVRHFGNLSASYRMRSAARPLPTSIVLQPDLRDRVDAIIRVSAYASKRRFPLRNILIFGRAGTGKTVLAEAVANASSLPYAFMSGADIAPLGSQGPAELRKLLLWAAKKSTGGIIVIDEAEVALGSRAKASNAISNSDTDEKESLAAGYSRDCLNVLLSMTGTFGNVALILTTTNPSRIDEAVLDRCDEIVHLSLPREGERRSLLRNQFQARFARQKHVTRRERILAKFSFKSSKARYDRHFEVDKSICDLARETEEASGRELVKYISTLVYKAYSSESGTLTKSLWETEMKARWQRVATPTSEEASRR